MPDPDFVPRIVEPRLTEALEDAPVVLLHGPRQSGKSTLVRSVGEAHGRTYLSFDDDVVREAATSDPVGFVLDLPARVTLDEIQRVPQLFTTLKAAVDRNRTPGRFLLTGSANVLLLPRLADSLAGRMAVLRLHPFAQVEVERAPAGFLDRLLTGGWAVRRTQRLGPNLAERIVAGGYPPALGRPSHRRRAAWYRDYVMAITQRDVRDLARIGALEALPKLVASVASQTARLVNVSALAAPFEVSRPTIRDYLTLLQHVFMVMELPAWHRNRLQRLVKAPKLHMGDTGVAAAVLGLGADDLVADRHAYGQLLETFVVQELMRQAAGHEHDLCFHHFRDRDGYEVDVVIERAGRAVAGVEVKAAATVTDADFRGLRQLARAAGDAFVAGVVLYDGEVSAPFGERLRAVPVRDLWEPV